MKFKDKYDKRDYRNISAYPSRENVELRKLVDLIEQLSIDGGHGEITITDYIRPNKHSLHHALALNKGCKFVNNHRKDSDFLLLCDPDFFVIPNHSDVLNHMIENDLSFFGAPYWPDGKSRPVSNFPVAFCMYVDLKKINISGWDFSPTYTGDMWMDTGYRIYSRYVESTHKFEIVHPDKIVKHFPEIAKHINIDTYFWKEKLFGAHVHAKFHLKNPAQINKAMNIIRKTGEFVKDAKQYNTII